MYLKSLELIGFKSFAEKTKLEFEPGITAIVGPNGCGKSNVADAIRWVLGEQSAKALRGSKMEDVIFNGTDSHKPLGMAEVSLTLADCEKILGTEYHEITITRRVFRNGEGQYFINKTPCRLKDIQRLFMDTGIGTNSYSLMEQGKIDRVLSSHPEDRRAVFEEASGITKFKADKKEALRKLEQTEANLLRLDDVIREVKRQIISLQRQAGKAQRYQELQAQLRTLDLFVTRERLATLDEQIRTLESRLASMSEQEEAVRTDISRAESDLDSLRGRCEDIERGLNETTESAMAVRAELDRARALIQHFDERRAELLELSERDTRDADEARARRAQHAQSLEELKARLERAEAERDAAEREMAEQAARVAEAERRAGDLSRALDRLRSEQLDLESRAAHSQNELTRLEHAERANVLRRERLAAEQAEALRAVEMFEQRRKDIQSKIAELRADVDRAGEHLAILEEQQRNRSEAAANLEAKLSALRSQAAAREAQIELMEASERQHEGFASGGRRLLTGDESLGVDRTRVLGALAELIQIDAEWQHALEAALRPWLDAILVDGDLAAIEILKALESRSAGAARLLSTSARPAYPPPEGRVRLLDRIRCPDYLRPALECILGHVCVVPSLADIPPDRPAGLAWVTPSGALINPNGTSELWRRDDAGSNPLTRRQLIQQRRTELDQLRADIQAHEAAARALEGESGRLDEALRDARRDLDERRRILNTAEGELHVIEREFCQARDRADTVAWELQAMEEQTRAGDERRSALVAELERIRARQEELRAAIAAQAEEVRAAEHNRAACTAEAAERRIRFAEARQLAQSLADACAQAVARVRELDALIEERSRGLVTTQARLEELARSRSATESRIPALEEEADRLAAEAEMARDEREGLLSEIARVEAALREKRSLLDEIRTRRAGCEVELAQQRMRRQNLLERAIADYRVTEAEVLSAPEPAWEDDQRPDRETLENRVAELKAKLEAMGPVNLVAIEEHRELEERYGFLTAQHADLTASKNQLMDMIRQINKTTTELFSETFAKVNENFQRMFVQLFGGGSAKLVLVDEGDILESGIEIIARPPGKKLQSVSLLSGGERTMTAVALLFALYLVKPSPFCVLDELDAALDDANIGRFVKTLQGFLDRSQFIVITHNRQTIAAAGTLYGVTMEQQGVSKIVSVRLSEAQGQKESPV
ncbi:MAG: chromosome segregation protein SMC [Kiritimatiellae bacterium]|nr:chromosome segregation protein SMC [Kiritimatiellia bacterium]MDW8458456.1 chromosome segregation protein SMC [Verrucomicrobiota bacterium]